MKRLLPCGFFMAMIALVVLSCHHDRDSAFADHELYLETAGLTGYTYYEGTPGISASLGNSPHGFERIRFNQVAFAALDTAGQLPPGGTFPRGAVIVKEVYSALDGALTAYAVMKKDPASPSAGAGYIWAEFDAAGKVLVSMSSKGSSCISCHSQTPNRDLVLSFDLH
jgi:hypothetical protein